ncbi:PLC-like phosphodiesterase [Violaceomyces palustris]|uniref:PLC-like phosphodiesterase n=1 Tax=Violaceomyces palustris TaxID=1673888 RepID=A0ACD0NZ89_9BASI|nr:PLC-like phosphodiesterase [Violaceomyces palustris]
MSSNVNEPEANEQPSTASVLTSKLSKLNPFKNKRQETDQEDLGEEVAPDSIAGGGHAARRTDLTKSQLRVSHALKKFLVDQGELEEQAAGLDSSQPTPALQALLDRSHIQVPDYVNDRSHPLSEYFISSSHNTYLMAHQLYGSSSAASYHHTLAAGARCVEIDAWDNEKDPDEPKVTHGYTLASHIPFRVVCETIRDSLDQEVSHANELGAEAPHPAPILLSLENHCGAHGQARLVAIMKETWGERLVSQKVDLLEAGEPGQEDGAKVKISLDDLGAKIAVMVEYHPASAPAHGKSGSEGGGEGGGQEEEDEISSDDDEDTKAYKEKKKATKFVGIIPELSALGVYAQSVKPRNDSWLRGEMIEPENHLINVSEPALKSLLAKRLAEVIKHNSEHLMRVYPSGMRISSKNLNPVPFWGAGAQVCALNWQTFDAAMQLNEALFSGTDGYVLKPPSLRSGTNADQQRSAGGSRVKLTLHVAGATDLVLPDGREADEIKPYVTCTLVHPEDGLKELADGEEGGGGGGGGASEGSSPAKRKTGGYKQHKLGLIHRGEQPIPTDPIWNEKLEWEFKDNDMVFLRILVKSDDRFARNPILAVAAVRLQYAVRSAWRFIRLLDLKGRETRSTLLVKFEMERV